MWAPRSSNSKVKRSGFSPVVRKSGTMYLSMAGVGCIIMRCLRSLQSYNFSGNPSVADVAGEPAVWPSRKAIAAKAVSPGCAWRCLYPHPVADAPFPPITGKRSSPLCTAVRRRAFGRTRLPARPCTSHQHKEGLVPAAAARCAAVTSTLSPSVPKGQNNNPKTN